MFIPSAAELALADFQFFCARYLGIKHYACQKVWCDDIQTVIDAERWDGTQGWDGLQLLAPADHGKTQYVVVPAIVWLLCRDRNNRIGIGSSIDEYAFQMSQLVMSYIENVPELERDFGLAKGDKWAVNSFKVARDNWREKSSSVLAFGVGAELQSQRFDYTFLDDGATRRNSRTEGQRFALRSFVNTDMNSRLDHLPGKGKEFFSGHRVEPNDLYSDNEGRPGWLYRSDKAIIDDTEKRILCPEKWTYEALSDKRARDPIGFELLYQQQAAGTGRFVTRTSMERVRVPTQRFYTSMDGTLRGQFRTTWLELDPAFTTTRWSSYAVMMLKGLTHEGKIRLLWGWREKVTPETLLPMMEMKFRLYMPDHFFIEDNAAQTMLISHMRRKFPDHSSKFKGITTINKDGSLDNEMVQLFEMFNQEQPIIEIPYMGPTEQAFAHAMTEEFVAYPSGKSRDILMCHYIGMKGMGKLQQIERRGYVPQRGVMGSVADAARRRYNFRNRMGI